MTSQRTAAEENHTDILNTIRSVARDCDRNPEEITLIGVTKGFASDVVELAADLGLTAVGENRVKAGVEKKHSLPENLRKSLDWHMIGHVQSNKVKHLLGEFEYIHSVDRNSLVDELDKRLSRNDLTQKILMQVNTSGEESKYGVATEEAPRLFETLRDRSTLSVEGLMTMAPYTDETSRLRETFAACRRLRDDLEEQFNVELPELSMGMTNDYREAIREGSTMLRIGRGLFGERPD